MDDKQYAKRALILALTSFIIATFPITMPILSILFDVPAKSNLRFVFGIPAIFGWIPGSIIAFIAYKMGQRMKGSISQINITRITSVLAFIGNFGFALYMLSALLFVYFTFRVNMN
jgi:hypothetical protein